MFDPELSLAEVNAAVAGSFRVRELVDSGGQGAVFRAETQAQDVALKIYFGDQVEERAIREVEALRSLYSDTIVRLYNSGHCQIRGVRCTYVATTFIHGRTVTEAIRASPLSVQQVARIAQDMASAVGAMWERRVVHRDIKPKNIMLANDGRSILIDLGIARHLAMGALTTTGTLWGTEGYLSPEQARGEELTCKSDIFALGIVMQECLLGRHPTAQRQVPLLHGGPPTKTLIDGIPTPVITLIDSMVHKSPVRRPLPEVIIERLANFLRSKPS